MGSFRNRRHPSPEVPAKPAYPMGNVMSVLSRNRGASADQATAAPLHEHAGPVATPTSGRLPRTRTGAAWLGVCIAGSAFVVLLVFMLQNTGSVEVSFLWMHGSVPLALALLVAAVGAAILTIAVGAARTTQLRRLSRRGFRSDTRQAQPSSASPAPGGRDQL